MYSNRKMFSQFFCNKIWCAVLFIGLISLGTHSFADDNSQLDMLFANVVAAYQKEQDATDSLNKLYAYISANMESSAEYLAAKRIDDNPALLSAMKSALDHYVINAKQEHLDLLVRKMMISPIGLKRELFYGFFWFPPLKPQPSHHRLAQACMNFLDANPSAPDDAIGALFSYLGFGCSFYGNDANAALRQWMRKQASSAHPVFSFMANYIIMSEFPWDKDLLAGGKKSLEAITDDSYAAKGKILGLLNRVKFCAREKYGAECDPQIAEIERHRSLAATDAKALAGIAAGHCDYIMSIRLPIFTLQDQNKVHHVCALAFYLGLLNKDNADGEKLLAAFFAEAPMDEVINTMADCRLSARQAFPELATKHGRQIFRRLGKHDTFVFAGLVDFINAYFTCPDIPDAEKAACRLLLEQALGLAPAENADK